jgi:hypothetical protein
MTVAGLAFAMGALGFRPIHVLGAPDQLTRARQILERQILKYAKAKDNPWLLIHGIRAMGPGFSLDESSALDYLCSHYLQEKSVNGAAYLYMPLDDEGHPNCFLSEAVLDAGVALNYAFDRSGRSYTIADVVAGAKAMFAFDPATFVPNDLAWSLIVFAHATDPHDDGWVNAYGKGVHFADVVEFAMITLEGATGRQMSSRLQPKTIHLPCSLVLYWPKRIPSELSVKMKRALKSYAC